MSGRCRYTLVTMQMQRGVVRATIVVTCACALSACGATGKPSGNRTRTASTASDTLPRDEVLALAGLGRFEGLCPRGATSWTLRFVVPHAASEAISYHLGTGAAHLVTVQPGSSIAFHLVPNATRTREPKQRFIPSGQPSGRTGPQSLSTTAPLEALIYQATEPQTLRANVRLALRTTGDESGRCVLVGSRVIAGTYTNSGGQ